MGFKRKKGDGEGEEMESEDRGRPNSNGTERRNVILPSMIKNKTVDPQHVVSIPLCAPYHWFTPTAHFKLSNLVLRKDIKISYIVLMILETSQITEILLFI
ncbi:hypothetical protein YC2023_037887 [Brassica napus]